MLISHQFLKNILLGTCQRYIKAERAPFVFFLNFCSCILWLCAGPSLLIHRFSLVAESGGCCLSWRLGLSFLWLWSLVSRPSDFSSCSLRTQEHRLGRCGARVWLPRATWNLPGPRSGPASPALAAEFLATGPPGKSGPLIFLTFRFETHMPL